MPRLTRRAFTDLAIWMVGFGLVIGLVFPPACVVLGLPAERVITIPFFAATVAAGLLVGAVNFALARYVVGSRLRTLVARMSFVDTELRRAAVDGDLSRCDPATCRIEVDSEDEFGASAAAFNGLVEALARSHGAEDQLRSFVRELSSRLALDDLGSVGLDGIIRIGGFGAGAFLVDIDGEVSVLASRSILEPATLTTTDHVRRVLRTAEREVIEIPTGVTVDGTLISFPARSIVVLPVAFKGVAIGVLVLAATEPIAPDTARLLDLCVANLGLALNNALAHHRLARVAALDPLTDALNRRFGLTRLQEEFARAVRADAPLGILMLDLDHFKAVNDTYGHPVGDRVLQAAARATRRVVREGDVLVRYGGEEFLVILPGSSRADLALVADRIRRAVADTTVADGEQSVAVTVSIGGCSLPETSVELSGDLVERADVALYAAKAGGRDGVVIDGLRPGA
jgi:diguanylate cyclase (GGDEF)-like protein